MMDIHRYKEKISGFTGVCFDGNIEELDADGVYVKLSNGINAVIGGKTAVMKCRALLLLMMNIKAGKTDFEIREAPQFDLCGPMIDVSSGKVMRVDALKEYIDRLAAMGFNMVMLYMEDTYEIDGYPKFGYLRGRYSHDEMKAIDDYAFSMGIEVIPCIQTLGHLRNFIKWSDTADYAENASTLLVDDERTYAFIEAALRTMRDCFRTRRIHLGMDEANGLGMGKHFQIYGPEEVLSIFNRHLKRVLDIADKYGYEASIWGDMYFSQKNEQEYYNPDARIPDLAIAGAPQNVELTFWDYYHTDKEYYHKKMLQFERFPNKMSFAGGAWSWDGLVPNFQYTLETMKPALSCCMDHGVKTVIATMWGREPDFFEMLESLSVFSELCYMGNDCTDEDIYNMASFVSGKSSEYIDAISSFHLGLEGSVHIGNGLFYSDPLINLVSYDIDEKKTIDTYMHAISVLDGIEEEKHKSFYRRIFHIAVLKAEMLCRLQKEYRTGNKTYLRKAAEEVFPKLRGLYCEFYEDYVGIWMLHNKPFGVEVYAQRIGGIVFRIDYTRKRLLMYCNGEIDRIEELDEEILTGLNLTWRSCSDYMNTSCVLAY